MFTDRDGFRLRGHVLLVFQEFFNLSQTQTPLPAGQIPPSWEKDVKISGLQTPHLVNERSLPEDPEKLISQL